MHNRARSDSSDRSRRTKRQLKEMIAEQSLLIDRQAEQIRILSAGQLNNILIHGKEAFHLEKSELLLAGVEAHKQINTDDTGARHKGQNQYTNVIGNKWFTV